MSGYGVHKRDNAKRNTMKWRASPFDALREADYFTRSRQGLDIAAWNHERLNDELEALADAWALLWAEELAQWI